MAATFTPNAVAREASSRTKRTITAKMVRGYARSNMARFSKATHPARQSHEYTAAERTRIVAAFVARAKGSVPAKVATPRKARAKVAKVATPETTA